MPQAIQLEEFRDKGFANSLRSAWQTFETRAKGNSPNVHPDYLALWLDILGQSCQAHVIAAWRDGELVGYAPLMESTDSSGWLSVPKVRFIGNNHWRVGDFQYLDIIATEPRAAIIKGILLHLKATRFLQEWDFGYLSPYSPTTSISSSILRVRHTRRRPTTYLFPVLDLPSDWNTYLKSLSKNGRGQFRQGLRRLQEHGEVSIKTHNAPEAVSQQVSEMIRNHDRWWRGTRRERWFGNDSVRRFFIEGARLLASYGRYLAFTLDLDGNPIAWSVGPRDSTRYYDTLTCYDQTFRFGSPGYVLHGLIMRELIARGIHRVEQGPGSERYKFDLGGAAVAYVRVRGYPFFPSSSLPWEKVRNSSVGRRLGLRPSPQD